MLNIVKIGKLRRRMVSKTSELLNNYFSELSKTVDEDTLNVNDNR